MSGDVVPYFEALRLLKDWSIVLLILQTGILVTLIFVAAYLKGVEDEKIKRPLFFTLVFSTLSILIGLNVIGTIPWSTQALPYLATKYHDIYQFRNYIGIPIWIIALGQHVFFVFTMTFLLAFAYALLRSKR